MDTLDKLTVPQLKAKLKERGADVKGKKIDLVKRLQDLLDADEDVSVADRNMADDPADGVQGGVSCGLSETTIGGQNLRAESIVSSRSSTSNASIKSLRAIEASKRAALRARASFLAEKRKIELEELNLRLRKEELLISAEIAESEAKERVLMESDDSVVAESAVNQTSGQSERHTEPSSHSLSVRNAETSAPSSRGGDSRDRRATSPEPITISNRPDDDGDPVTATAQTAQRPELPQTDISQAIFTQLQKGQLPKLEIPVFDGDVTKYRCFIRAFDSRIASKTDDPDERLYYLQTYVCGKPLEIIRRCMHMSDGSGYLEARRLLERRYGEPDSVSAAFVDILTEWNPIKPGDVDGLDKFSIALTSCLNVMQDVPPGSRETDHPRTMRKIVEKLPYHCQDSWRSRVIQIKEEARRKVIFEDIVSFVDREVRKLTDPTFGKLVKTDMGVKRAHTVSATAVDEIPRPRAMKCLYCGEQHHTDSCEEFNDLPYEYRKQFIFERGLCFGCLRRGHQFSACAKKLSCRICRGRHPTSLHKGRPSSPAAADGDAGSTAVVKNGRLKASGAEVSGGTRGSSSTMMAIIPVIVRSPDGSRSVVTQAFLDLGSSASFCTDSLLKKLNAEGKSVNLKMLTATAGNQSVQCKEVNGLSISGLDAAWTIQLPPTFTLNKIPVKHEDIATPEDIERWTHLKGISTTQSDAEIGLMIGGNCPEALCPLETRRGAAGEPFAFRSRLGWTVCGPRWHNSASDKDVDRSAPMQTDTSATEKPLSKLVLVQETI